MIIGRRRGFVKDRKTMKGSLKKFARSFDGNGSLGLL
jgi:hypothetical protein